MSSLAWYNWIKDTFRSINLDSNSQHVSQLDLGTAQHQLVKDNMSTDHNTGLRRKPNPLLLKQWRPKVCWYSYILTLTFNLIYNCSLQRSLTKCAYTGNIHVILSYLFFNDFSVLSQICNFWILHIMVLTKQKWFNIKMNTVIKQSLR